MLAGQGFQVMSCFWTSRLPTSGPWVVDAPHQRKPANLKALGPQSHSGMFHQTKVQGEEIASLKNPQVEVSLCVGKACFHLHLFKCLVRQSSHQKSIPKIQHNMVLCQCFSNSHGSFSFSVAKNGFNPMYIFINSSHSRVILHAPKNFAKHGTNATAVYCTLILSRAYWIFAQFQYCALEVSTWHTDASLSVVLSCGTGSRVVSESKFGKDFR